MTRLVEHEGYCIYNITGIPHRGSNPPCLYTMKDPREFTGAFESQRDACVCKRCGALNHNLWTCTSCHNCGHTREFNFSFAPQSMTDPVSHIKMINGKKVAVTKKGNVKDLKDTRFYNDPKGMKYSGIASKSSDYDPKTRTYTSLTSKGKSKARRQDFE